MADWATAKSADGPKVVAWVLKNVPGITYENDPDAMRRLYDWDHEDALASIDALDRMLVRHHRHLWELPDDVWSDVSARGRGKADVIEPKPCRACGEPIPTTFPNGKGRGKVAYAKTQYCSLACVGKATGLRAASVPPKPCEVCGELIPTVDPHTGHSLGPGRYAKVRFCSKACYGVTKRKKVAA